jgi:hypothetical protein
MNLKTVNEKDRYAGASIQNTYSRHPDEPLTGNFKVSKAFPPLPPSHHLAAISQTPNAIKTDIAVFNRCDNHTGIDSIKAYQRHIKEISTSKSQHLSNTRESFKNTFKRLNDNLGKQGMARNASCPRKEFNYIAFQADLKSTQYGINDVRVRTSDPDY